MHETTDDLGVAIWRGTRTRKSHSSKRNAFTSFNDDPIGIVNEKIDWKGKYKPICDKTTIKPGFDDNIAMVWAHPGFNVEDWENLTSGKNGVVIAGTGLGHINSELLDIVRTKTAKGVDFRDTPFAPYSASYLKQLQREGKPTKVDLFYSGRMLGALTPSGRTIKKTGRGKVSVGFSNAQMRQSII